MFALTLLRRFAFLAILSAFASAAAQDKPATRPVNEPLGNPGVFPVGADGQPLNLNFEDGTLKDWTVEGKAFEGQPIKGEIDPKRPFGAGKKSDHTGQFWIGGFEKLRDTPIGTLTSAPFEVTQPFASFLVAGGSHKETRVELVTADDGKVFFTTSGPNQETLRPVIVDLTKHKGKKIFIRLVDQHTGGWGHVNFDDFRLHTERPKFKESAKPAATPSDIPAPDATALYPHKGLSPQEAVKAMQLPPGFAVQVAAAEPDVQQPIAMAIDDRGRIWIAEAYEYPIRAKGDKGRDRILIFEDTDLNGTLDKRTIFYEGLNLVSGLELGFGGVWVGAAPYLYFIPDKNGDDVPDGEPQILLDGWGYDDTHETLNSFIWGPDGWLYGCHGVFTHSAVGKPGTPDEKRTKINAGVWRYHPVRHEFEVFAHGTSNPWGLDYDQYGNFFATACVIPHLYHIIPGARYERQAGQHFNPYTYNDIKTIADHRHYTGNQWNDANRRQSDEIGGGHAHAGCMIYQGGAWPEKYRGAVFMNNIHGNRINVDLLTPKGSGFVASHGPDFLLTRDQASQMLALTYGPDGQVWVIDWYDMQQCHRKEIDVHDRTNGRIYRIVHQDAKPVRVDLQKQSDEELVRMLGHENEWYRRHAQRILQERGDRGREFHEVMAKAFDATSDESIALRHLWTLDAQGSSFAARPATLRLTSPRLRGWALRLAMETDTVRKSIATIGLARDASPVVRMEVVAACLKQSPAVPNELFVRWKTLEDRFSNQRRFVLDTLDDSKDHNLPLMYWYAMEPLADVDPARALALAFSASKEIPFLKDYMIRRIGSGGNDKALELLVQGLADAKDEASQLAYLRGISQSIVGRVRGNAPPIWSEVYARLSAGKNDEAFVHAAGIGSAFGDSRAVEALCTNAEDRLMAVANRQLAIQYLLRFPEPPALVTLLRLAKDASLRSDALRGLATFDDAKIPPAILSVYGELTPTERRDALATLSSRPAFAAALLDAVAGGKVPAGHLTADLVTQLRNLSDVALNKRIEQVWGVVRESPADKAKLIGEYKALLLSKAGGTPAPLELGRAIFAKTCQNCHTLFGTGGKIGPDLTGSQRTNLDYLLQNIVDPSAVMAKEYQPIIVRLADGRVVTGIKKEETADSLSLQTATELVAIAKADIDEMKQSDKSMMPDNQLQQFTPQEVRSLVAYLAAGGQTPLLATKDNVGSFYSGKDLAGWVGDPKLWSVENGEIVGKTTGLAKNEFLISELSLTDFRLELEVKLVDDKGNSGIQIRSVPIENGLMRGYQCDIGPGWWGKLYEEHGRALLEAKGGEEFVKKGDWNRYEIVAAGSRVRTWINGQLCVDRDDPLGARSGVLGLQLHSGGPTEVHYRNLKLTLLPTHVPALPYPASIPSHQPDAPARVSFKKTTLDRAFRSEGVGMGDFNNDGLLDISAGSVWYENPGQGSGARGQESGVSKTPALAPSPSPSPWPMHVIGTEPKSFNIKTYGDTFMNWAEDVDGDGRLDQIVVDFPGKQTWWFQNPGSVGQASRLPWKKHVALPTTNGESPLYVDLDGDGRREIIYGDAAGRLSLARPQANPLLEWKATPISATGEVSIQPFFHGLGVGDLNKDGRSDLLVPAGWWENVGRRSAAGQAGGEPWTFHPAPFGQPQAQMYVFDFDGDGDADVVGSSAHRRGIWWYEQQPDGKWQTHLIDESIAQTHALVLADMNGDGLPDLVTGKRFYAHNGNDPGEDEPPIIAWYELPRDGGKPQWTRHEIDADSGVGTQFEVHDMNADGLLDIIVANKRGVFYFEQTKE
ncbi:MAG: family 16 glycoside hydrolase [Pirellulaceae bacterium]|nr:family 16 glycoside hydrolase [Pirellulaceae bacterium]